MIKVLIADDHILIREGFKKIIGKELDLTVIGEAENAEEALQIIREEECDVAVLDISMPGKTGLDLIRDLKEIMPHIKILILSMHPEDRFAVRALKAGASGYLTKESAPDELVKAIRKVADGRKYVSPNLAEQLAFEITGNGEKQPHELLSDREFQIFRMIAIGKKISEIADELYLSKSTVNTYRSRIFEKMNLQSNSELVHYAIRNKLIE